METRQEARYVRTSGIRGRMINTLQDIDLDYLKKNHLRLYYFGLGFIQLKIDETYRLHFYSPELPSITEDIHNHRYHFTSKVLKGNISNFLWKIEDGDSHLLKNESCNPDITAPVLDKLCSAKLVELGVYETGHSYQLTDDVFHQVEAENCVTLLKRGDYTKEFAQIVIPKDEQSVCPFSKKIDETTLWKLIKDML